MGGTGGGSYPVGTTYNDAGQALMLTYPNGETVTASYSAAGWLGSLTRTLSGTPPRCSARSATPAAVARAGR